MVVLQNCPDDPELLSVLSESCDKITKGRCLGPWFWKRFGFTIYGRDEVRNLKKTMGDDCPLMTRSS